MNTLFKKAELLSRQEAMDLPVWIRIIDDNWWLKPQNVTNRCEYMSSSGYIQNAFVGGSGIALRPVVTATKDLGYPEKSIVSLDEVPGLEWYYLGKNRYLCMQGVEYSWSWNNKSDFETSQLLYWFEKMFLTLHRSDIDQTVPNYVCPKGIKIIDDGAFEGNENLREVVIPDSVERLGNNAFLDCINLEKVTLGTGLKSGGSGVFLHCRNLKEVYVRNLESLLNYRCDNFGSPLQYGANLYIKNKICREVVVPDDIDSCYSLSPLIGCGSIKKYTIEADNPKCNELLNWFKETCTNLYTELANVFDDVQIEVR